MSLGRLGTVVVAGLIVVSACGVSRAPAQPDVPLETAIAAFIETPSSPLASSVAAAMAADGDQRWGPWLLDLLRLGPSNLTDEDVAEALETLSGIDRPEEEFITHDYRVYGQWVYTEAIDPGPGYREWKIALYDDIDVEYVDLLDSIPDDLVLSRVQWGGVRRGGIPELNDHERVPTGEADWMVDDEIVFGVHVDGIAVAYPFRILGHHELANDTIGDTPVSLVFCTLCRTALLFDRRVAGDVLDFQTSGLLLNSNKVMIDTQTDTLWNHLAGVGIGGPHEGVELDQLPVQTTTWGEWRAEHPDTEVLTIPDPIYFDDPERGAIPYEYEPDSPYTFYYDNPDVWFPILDTPTDTIELKDLVIGLDLGGEQLAVALDPLVDSGARVFEVGDRPVLVVPVGETGARVYDASGSGLSDGEQPVLAGHDGTEARLADGSRLPRLTANQGFWFAWFGDNPDTAWWPQ